jgi:hypothetical protein
MSTTKIENTPQYKKLKVTSGVIVTNPGTVVQGEVIAIGDDNVVVRQSDAQLVVVGIAAKHLSAFKTKDQVIFSEHGILTEHKRLEEPKVKTETPKKSGSIRMRENV